MSDVEPEQLSLASKPQSSLRSVLDKQSGGLEVSGLTKSYGDVVAVDNLSFHVRPGEILGLIGPNGAGKSTCMMLVIGLLRADAGDVKLNGNDYDARDGAMRSLLGMVPQELAIYPELTAAQNLRFFGGLYGLRGPQLKRRVDYVLELTGLTQNANRAPRTFSGGMCRRLNFGIALLHEPRFVILDEPTVGIDPQSRTNLLDCIRELSRSGVGVLYASHYMEEIEAVCNRVAVMDHGRLLQQGTLDEVLDKTKVELVIRVGELPAGVLEKLNGIGTVHRDAAGINRIFVRENLETDGKLHTTRLREVLDLLEDANVSVLGMETNEMSLETLFLRLTGRKLRD